MLTIQGMSFMEHLFWHLRCTCESSPCYYERQGNWVLRFWLAHVLVSSLFIQPTMGGCLGDGGSVCARLHPQGPAVPQ